MNLGDHEGVVVYDPSNMFYLSGYTGEGLVLVSRGISAIVTDFRYTEQAKRQCPGFTIADITPTSSRCSPTIPPSSAR